jgi:hypothetical protein
MSNPAGIPFLGVKLSKYNLQVLYLVQLRDRRTVFIVCQHRP